MRILLIKRGAMGDILMTTPLIRQLRRQLPEAIIDYCLAKSFATTLANNQYLSSIIALDDNLFAVKHILRFFSFAFSIRKQYDYVFILGKNWQFNLLSNIFAGIKVGYAREKISKLLLSKYVVYNDINRYHGLYYLDLLQASGLATPDYTDVSLDLSIPEQDKHVIRAKCQEVNLTNFVVVVNSGGNNQYEASGIRMLPPHKITSLLKALLAKHQVVLVGGKADKENYLAYANMLHSPVNLFNWAGELSLTQSAYLISLAQHFYTTDCGAMHLGVRAQLGSKMTCLFGPTHPNHVLPQNKGFKIYWQDQELFDPGYPLLGKIKQPQIKYFTTLEVSHILN
jgi:ADP-heptose:LPS heptosyltransferase